MVQPDRLVVPLLRVPTPPPLGAELPVTVQSISVSVPPAFRRPPPTSALPPVMVSPDSDACPSWTSNTRLLPPPLTVKRLAPGPLIVVVALFVKVSGPADSVMDWEPTKTVGSKPIETVVASALGRWGGGG